MRKQSDPLIRAARKAYRQSHQARLDVLLEHEYIWKRKFTVATNRLKAVRKLINALALELVKASDRKEP